MITKNTSISTKEKIQSIIKTNQYLHFKVMMFNQPLQDLIFHHSLQVKDIYILVPLMKKYTYMIY